MLNQLASRQCLLPKYIWLQVPVVAPGHGRFPCPFHTTQHTHTHTYIYAHAHM